MENDSRREDEVEESASDFKTISRLLVEIQKNVKTEMHALTEGKYKPTHIQDKKLSSLNDAVQDGHPYQRVDTSCV